MEEGNQQVGLSGNGQIMNNMKDWKEIARKIFPKEYEEFCKISGRNPTVEISTIEGDVNRRDIPWNALFYDLDKHSIIDLVGGIEDLKNSVTRFVGDPKMRITEDPLRILRLIRFTSRYNFKIDEDSAKAIEENKDKLKIIVRERIWDEFYKAYGQVKDFTIYLNYITQFGLWEYVFPGMEINTKQIKTCSSIELYLALLFISNKGEFENLRDKLNKTCNIPDTSQHPFARIVAFLVWLESFEPEKITEYYSKRNNIRISDKLLREWLKIAGLSGVNWYEAFIDYRPSVSSQELMAKGFKGAALGQEIKRLEIENFSNLLKKY